MARHINESAVMSMIDKMDDGMEDTDLVTNEEENEEEGEEDEEEQSGTPEDDNSEDEDEGLQQTSSKTESGNTDGDKGNTSATETAKNIRRQGNNFVDDKNNIVDPQTGQIIAKAGTERRLFEKTQRLGVALDNKSQALAKYELEDKTFDNLRGKIKSHGLSVDEFAEGINMVIAYKSDPIGTAKKVLESVLAMGHNVTDILGADAGNAIEMSAVSKMLDERLKPLLQPLDQKRVSDENTEKAQKAWEKFCDENEYADVHEVTLDRMLGSNPDLTPQKAYNALRQFAYDRNLDFSLPLGPQIERLQSAKKNNSNRGNPPRTQKPFPNGSSVPQGSMNSGDVSPNDDWATIIKKAVPGIRQ